MDARYELAYREALRTVDDQARTLDAVRARAGTLFSSAGVVVAVIGFVLRDGAKGVPRCLVLLAVVSFAVLALATLAVGWPTRKGRFRMGAVEIVGDWIEGEGPLTLEDMYRDLALHHGNNAGSNEELIRDFFRCYVAGLVAFAVLVVSLVVAVWEVM